MWEEFLDKHNIRGSERERFFDEMRMFEIRWIRRHPQYTHDGETPPEIGDKKEQERKQMLKDFLRSHYQMMGMSHMDEILKSQYDREFQSEIMDKFSYKFIDDPNCNRKEMEYIVDKVERLSKTVDKEKMRRFLLSLEPGFLKERKYEMEIKKLKEERSRLRRELKLLKEDNEEIEGSKHLHRERHPSGNKWEKFKEEPRLKCSSRDQM